MGSSSSSSKSIACGTVYTHSSWHTGSAKGMVKVWSCRIPAALWLGVHHAIVVDVPSNRTVNGRSTSGDQTVDHFTPVIRHADIDVAIWKERIL